MIVIFRSVAAAAISASIIFAFSPAVTAAEAKDLFMAVMKDDTGQFSVHYQPSADCMAFLKLAKADMQSGKAVRMTFVDPAFTGTVVEASCVDPLGKVIGTIKSDAAR